MPDRYTHAATTLRRPTRTSSSLLKSCRLVARRVASALAGSRMLFPTGSRWRIRLLMTIFVGGLFGIAVALLHLDRWISYCRAQAQRCATRAEKWEKNAETFRKLEAIGYKRLDRQKLEGREDHLLWVKRDTYLAEQSSKVAALYRAEETRWRWWIGAETTRPYQYEELYREPDWSPR